MLKNYTITRTKTKKKIICKKNTNIILKLKHVTKTTLLEMFYYLSIILIISFYVNFGYRVYRFWAGAHAWHCYQVYVRII